jgi:septal ring factor EnvC (AmiA/AmiB activator)
MVRLKYKESIDVWKKIKEFFKNAFIWIRAHGGIIGCIALVLGFFIGRKLTADGDIKYIEQLRADNARLVEESETICRKLSELERERESDKRATESIRTELESARRNLDRYKELIGNSAENLGQLSDTNRRLREFIEKYSKGIESLKNS